MVVKWGLAGDSNYSVGRNFGLIMDSMLGSQFEEGLQNLKSLCENETDENDIKTNITEAS